jgi:hypothetical protein
LNVTEKKLTSLLRTYNLSHRVNIAARIHSNSCTAIDNMFVDTSRINLSSIAAIINDLSDLDAQILTIKIMSAIVNKLP